MVGRPQLGHRDPPLLEVANCADVIRSEELPASGVDSCQKNDRCSTINVDDEWRGECHADVGLARSQGPRGPAWHVLDIPHFGEAFSPKKCFRHILRRHTDNRALGEPDRRRLGRRLGADRPRMRAEHRGGPGQRRRLEKLAPRDHPFSSFFSSFRKRQSVPLAMICCGVALSIPTSRSRRAKKRTVSSASYWRHWPYGISLTTLSARS